MKNDHGLGNLGHLEATFEIQSGVGDMATTTVSLDDALDMIVGCGRVPRIQVASVYVTHADGRPVRVARGGWYTGNGTREWAVDMMWSKERWARPEIRTV